MSCTRAPRPDFRPTIPGCASRLPRWSARPANPWPSYRTSAARCRTMRSPIFWACRRFGFHTPIPAAPNTRRTSISSRPSPAKGCRSWRGCSGIWATAKRCACATQQAHCVDSCDPQRGRLARCDQRLDEDPVYEPRDQRVFHGPERRPVLALEFAQDVAALPEQSVDAVEGTDLLVLDVLGRGAANDVARHPPVHGRHPARAQRPLDVAEEDDARDAGLVFRRVDERLVEENVLPVAPRVRLAVDEDPAIVGVR